MHSVLFRSRSRFWLLGTLLAYGALAWCFYDGPIPVNSGAGWDGYTYLSLIKRVANDGAISAIEPYRFMRIGAFIPHIVFYKLTGASDASLVLFAQIHNAFLGLGVLALIFESCQSLGINVFRSAGAAAAAGLTWPLLIMPFLYPLLSDHFSVFISALAIYLHITHRRTALGFILVWSFFVMPLLSAIPLILYILRPDSAATSTYIRSRMPAFLSIAVPIAAFTCALFWRFCLSLSEPFLLSRLGCGATQAALSLRYYSLAISTLLLFAALAAIGIVLLQKDFWQTLLLRRVIIAAFLCLISLGSVFALAAKGSGMGGPPLGRYLAMQSMTLPGGPLIAHLAHNGPLFLLGITGIILSSYRTGSLKSIAIAGLPFLPFLAIGSESRQFVCILPIAAILAVSVPIHRVHFYCLCGANLLFLLPGLFPATHLQAALLGGEDFQSWNWQHYFGRQGPWMSVESHMLYGTMGLLLALILLALQYYINSRPVAMNSTHEGLLASDPNL